MANVKNNVSISPAQIQKDWFVEVAIRYSGVLGHNVTKEEAEEAWLSTISDSGLAIRALAYRVKDLQTTISLNASGDVAENYNLQQKMIAASYKSGKPLAAAGGSPNEVAAGYADSWWAYFEDADAFYCDSEYYRCGGM